MPSPTARSLASFAPALTLTLALVAVASPGLAQPTFSKTFSPDSIGPGSHSRLTFTIENGSGTPVIDLAFVDNLPAGVTIATPASASTDCGDGIVTAPDGGNTIALTDGEIGIFTECTVAVDVTSSTLGTHMNVSGDLTSNVGNSGPAIDDLTVTTAQPGFSKSFSPTSIGFGGRSTLTFTLDNSANGGIATGASFTDVLPAGLLVADPANASTDCLGATFTATAGSNTISMIGGALLANTTCTATVDIAGEGLGTFVNRSSDLSSSPGGPSQPNGFAVDTLDVVALGEIVASKSFLDDPVNPGDTVELEFTLTNRDRSASATGIAFTDDLDATLSGLVATGLPAANVCGAGSTLSGTDTLSLTGGDLPAGGSCTFSVTLQLPAMATAGGYPNTTSTISATIGGSPATGDPATETLFVNDAPGITKTFLTDPVGAGDAVQLEFTITNNSSTSSATDIAFMDNLSSFLSGVVYTSGFQSNICGAGSGMSLFSASGQNFLNFFGGNLAPGASCTFTADLLVPENARGTFTNVTEPISATIDGTTQMGGTATDTLTVAGAPRLTKAFTDDPVAPGGTVTLEFTLEHDLGASADATAITFTDDLDAALSGLAATGLPMNDICGVGSSISGASSLTFSGGTLAPGATCTFSVTLDVPAGALPGEYTNVTSNVTATVDGVTTTGTVGTDVLTVAGIEFTKEFIDDPLIPGATGTLRFTIDNTSTIDVSGMFFTDSLTSALSGLAATGTLPMNPCGAGSTISGTTTLIFTGGNLVAGTSCTFDVMVEVPAAAANGSYVNTTSNLVVGTPSFTLPPAADALTVDDQVLAVTKTFTNDPVVAGGTALMEIALTNTSATETVTGITLTDDLDAMLSGATATGLPQPDVCGAGSSISGAGLVTLMGGSLAPGATCTITVAVQVPAAAPDGTYPNVTSVPTGTTAVGAVTGNAAADDLVVRSLVFSKAFLSSAEPGQTVDLQFLIDNPGSAAASPLSFTDNLDAVLSGLVATGLPMSDVCGSGSSISGTSLLTFSGGSLDAGDSCLVTITLQVPLDATVGTYPNVSSELTSSGLPVAGEASDDLEIVAPASVDATLTKSFQSSPVLRGQSVDVDYTITNSSPLAISSIAFTDDFDAALTGLLVTAVPGSTSCGSAVVGGNGTSTLTFSGGSLAAGASCSFSVTVQVPDAAPAGTVTSTTSTLDFVAAGAPFSNAPASDTFDVALLGFTKAFQADPVMPGDTVDLLFTITNPDPTNAASGLAFTDDLDAMISGLVATGLPGPDPCGAGSSITGAGLLSFTGGDLAAGGSCSFTVTLQVPVDAVAGTFTNTTSDLTAGAVQLGLPASDDLTVDAPASVGVTITKAFAALSPVLPGGSITLDYTITNSADVPVSALAFTDDLDAALAGLVWTNGPLSPVCGAGSTLSGTGQVVLASGSLAPMDSCTFQVIVRVPTDAPSGTVTSTSGTLSFTAAGEAFTDGTASDSFDVEPLGFTKTFDATSVRPGDVVGLTFTITNPDPGNAATGIAFTDDLDAVAPGLEAVSTPLTDPCGVGSSLTGTSTITLTDGDLAPGDSCTFTVDVLIPDVPSDTYVNITSPLSSEVGGSPVAGDPADAATADLVVANLVIEVPTLGTWSLLLLASLLALLAVGRMRLD